MSNMLAIRWLFLLIGYTGVYSPSGARPHVVSTACGAPADALMASTGLHMILTMSSLPNSCPIEVSAKYACPCMKHVTGFVNSAGRRITTVALSRLQSRTSEVTAVEQINMIAISIRKISRALKVGPRVG